VTLGDHHPGASMQSAPPGAFGTEVAGPAMVELVTIMARTASIMHSLEQRAKAEARQRLYAGRAAGQTDANGDVAIPLFEVPQGATGYLMRCAIDFAGVTPAGPLTNANLWHAIYEGGPPGSGMTAAQVVAVGNLLDAQPQSPTVDAVLPYVYAYGDRYAAPVLVGPGTFWAIVDAATAARQVGVRYSVLVEQPEP